MPADSPGLFVYRPGALGDALLARVALSALRRAFPSHRVTLATHAAAAGLLRASGLADQTLSQDDPALLWLFDAAGRATPPPPPPAVAVLWTTDPDGVVRRSAERAGIRGVVVARSRPEPGSRVHAAQHLLDSLQPLGVSPECSQSPLLTPAAAAETAADAWLAGHALDPGAFAAIHPGSGSPAKNWPLDRFLAAADALAAAGLRPLLSLGPAEEALAAAVHGAAVRHAWPLAEGQSVDVLAALLARAAVYLGNDSGVSHLAAAVGAPTLALFGPTDPATWAPLGPRVRVLRDPGWTALSPYDVAARALELARQSPLASR